MAAPPADAVRLQALDPGAGRRARAGFVVMAATLALLAWQPWESERAEAVAPVPSRVPAPAVVAVSPTPRPDSTLAPRPFAPLKVLALPEDWGVAAYTELQSAESDLGSPSPRELRLRTFAVAPFVRVDDPLAWYGVCGERAPAWKPVAAVMRSDRIRVLGVTVPPSAARARITVSRVGGGSLDARQVAGRTRRLEAERIRPPYALFALPRYGAWGTGVYRFDVHLPGGAFRHLYACVID